MANVSGKKIDTTYLALAKQTAVRGYIHRDYLAHCLRYSHIAKYLTQNHRYKTAHVLDVGCGRETPLPSLMYSMRMTQTSGSYTGVDYGPIIPAVEFGKKFKATFQEKVDFADHVPARKSFDVISSLEVLEHVEAEHAYRMLLNMRKLIAKNGRVFLSTPCYDGKQAAANHVNEMSYEGFMTLILAAGFEIDRVWGTFANQRDYKEGLFQSYPGSEQIFNELTEYYDSNVVACLFAPLFAQVARNCLWRLKPGKVLVPDAGTLKNLSTPQHGSSADWASDLKKIVKAASKAA